MGKLSWRKLPDPWQGSASPPLIEAGEIHLFEMSLQVSGAAELERWHRMLGADEVERAKRFRQEKHRRRFIVARGKLRQVLGIYLALDSSTLSFTYGPAGKPGLPGRTATNMAFNLSHSDELAILAIARGLAIGVDVERVCVLAEFDELVERFFSRRESEAFAKLPERIKPNAFFNLWTRKEALLKATGEGIAHCLNSVEVTFLPQEPTRLLAAPKHFGAVSDWGLRSLDIGNRYAAAIAFRSGNAEAL